MKRARLPGRRGARHQPRGAAALLGACAALAACGQGPLAPESSGGEPVEATRGLDPQGGDPFSISPDGRWLLFALGRAGGVEDAAPNQVADEWRARLASYRLHDLSSGRTLRPGISAEVDAYLADGGHVLGGAGCWLGERVALHATVRRFVALRPWRAAPVWELVVGRDAATFRGCGFPDRRAAAAGRYGPVRLELPADGSAVLRAAGSARVLARHAPGAMPGLSVHVAFVAVSSDGARVAYGVTERFGSFVGNTALHAIDDASRGVARALAAPAFAARWAPDAKTLYAHVKTAGEGASRHAVYRWRLGE